MIMKVYMMVVVTMMLITGCSGSSDTYSGLAEGQLRPCPDKPNCVLSQTEGRTVDSEHTIKPFEYSGSPERALAALETIVKGLKRTRITTREARYIHAEFTSAVFRFVDDVEFLADEKKPVIHVRSASRTGRSDFGVNRKRVEEIRTLFRQTPEGKKSP